MEPEARMSGTIQILEPEINRAPADTPASSEIITFRTKMEAAIEKSWEVLASDCLFDHLFHPPTIRNNSLSFPILR